MKRIFTYLSIAAIAMTVISCQKEKVETEEEATIHTVSFAADCNDTKTAISVDQNTNSISMNWSNTPDSYVHLFENGEEGTSPAISITDADSKATLIATFSSIVTVGSFDYRAVIASSYSNGVVTVPAIQHPAKDSFDPAADVLLGYSDRYYLRPHEIFELATANSIKLRFARANALTRLELSGLGSGEKVEAVTITAEENIIGPLNALKDFEYDGYDREAGSKTVTLDFTEDNTVSEEGKFVTYFSSWAVAPGAVTIYVVTDKSRYSKTTPAEVAQRLYFGRDKINTIRTNLENQDLPESRFELVTGTPSTWDGTYLFVNSDKAGAAKVLNTDAKSKGYAEDVTIKDIGGNILIEGTDAIKDLAWDISNTGKTQEGNTLWNVMTGTARLILSTAYYLYDNNGIYVSRYNFSGLILTRKYYYHMFAADQNGVQMTCTHNGTNTYFGFKSSSFGYSSDASSRVYLFKYNDAGRQSQILAYENEVLYWTLDSGKYEIGKTYDGQPFSSSSVYQKDLLSFSSSDTSVATVDSEGRVTILKEGEVTITATVSPNANYRGASASYDIKIAKPYYQRITDISELTSGGTYLIVSKTELLGSWYHAFCATNEETYDYDINTLSNILSSPISDNGNKIKPSEAINANQVVIEKGILSSSSYTIKPLSVNKYLYCNTDLSSVVSSEIVIPTYEIAFAESSGSSWLQLLEQIATAPHSIKFDEDGRVSITSAFNSLGLGGTIYYSKLTGEFSYVNLTLFEQFDDMEELIEYLGENSEYASLLKLINSLGGDITITDLINYFAADIYLYKYIG